jgi:regulation of enolase protein 1 (concanavalin A-like superfamily)
VIFAGAPPGSRVIHPLEHPPVSAPIDISPPGSDTGESPLRTPPSPPVQRDAPPPYMASISTPCSKWVKCGLELYNSELHASSVSATSEGADWALVPLPYRNHRRTDLKVKLERVGFALWIWFATFGPSPSTTGPDSDADSQGGRGWAGGGFPPPPGMAPPGRGGDSDALEFTTWKKLREVTWFFWGVEEKAVRVGVYACRPASFGPSVYGNDEAGPSNNGERALNVDFEGLEIF